MFDLEIYQVTINSGPMSVPRSKTMPYICVNICPKNK